MDEKQLLIHYESQIEVLQKKINELFKSTLEKDVITLNYQKSAANYTSTIEGLTMKLQEFEGAQDSAVAAVESRDLKISELEKDLKENKIIVQKQREDLQVAQDQITVALKEYDEQYQKTLSEAIKGRDEKIVELDEKLTASKGDNNVEIQNLRKSAKDFEVANRNNIQALNKANTELSKLKEETVTIRENEVQASRIASQLKELKGQQQAKIEELSKENEELKTLLEEATKPKNPTRRRKSAASK